MMEPLTVIILTKNEACHIARAIGSVRGAAERIVVVDSGSDDATVAIARAEGAQVLTNAWINHASQFNWALDQIGDQPGWVLRLDADEIATPELINEISAGLSDVDGCYIPRRIWFMGTPVRFGGVADLPQLRLFRNGRGRCEQTWMDEHIVVTGPTARLRGRIIDDNHKPLDWWIAKHNSYASREVIELLNHQYGFLTAKGPAQGGAKRFVKDHIYGRLPGGLRAGAYFVYRYILRLGVLDAGPARRFHVLQGFWYRYLVDAKYAEARNHMARTGDGPVAAISAVLQIDLAQDSGPVG